MALVHDLAESKIGDITPHDRISKEEKYRKEKASISVIIVELLYIHSHFC